MRRMYRCPETAPKITVSPALLIRFADIIVPGLLHQAIKNGP